MALATAAPRTKRSSARTRELESRGALPNVARTERIGSVVLGAALVTFALREREPAGILAAMLGGALLLRGATGHCPVYHAMGVSTGSADAVLGRPRDDVASLADVNASDATILETTAVVVVEPVMTIEADRPAF